MKSVSSILNLLSITFGIPKNRWTYVPFVIFISPFDINKLFVVIVLIDALVTFNLFVEILLELVFTKKELDFFATSPFYNKQLLRHH